MTIPPEQTEQIKKQLLTQVERMPEEQREQVKKYIESLNEEELEEFLKQNKIEVAEKDSNSKPASECVFCSIVQNQIPSYKLAETDKELAILEINPLSKGHSIIIPKQHLAIEKIPKSALSLSHKIAKKIKKKLKPEDIKIETSSMMNHAMINVIPIYKDIPLKKSKEKENELRKLQSKLETKTREKRKPKQKPEKSIKINLPEFKMRIPR